MDPDSLLHTVQRLTAVRLAHEALQSNAPVEFVYVQENTYPLAYIRRGGSEELLIILNPSSAEVTFPGAFAPSETVHCLGGEAGFAAGTVTVPASSAGIYCLLRTKAPSRA